MSALLVDYDAPKQITRPSWTIRWHTDSVNFAPSEFLDAIAVRIYSDIAHESLDDVRDLARAVRAAILVRRAELRALDEARAATLVAWVEEQRARSNRHGYHVLPHHEGGYQIERNGVSLAKFASRREAYEQRNALAAAAEARESA